MAVFFCYRSSALVCSIILAVTLGKGLSASDHRSLCDMTAGELCAIDIDKITQWIEQGGEVDCRSKNGESFLCLVGHCYHRTHLTKFLLEHGASVTKVNDKGWTVLHEIAMLDNIESAELILEHGGSVHDRDEKGYTPFAQAVIWGREQMEDFLLRHGASVEEPDARGQTLLMKAAIQNDHDLAKDLLELGADPFARDAAGLTARDLACAAGNLGLCRSLPKPSGAEQWRRLSTSRPFWMVLASSALIAIGTYCWPVSSPPPFGETAPFSRESVLVEQAEGRYSRGSVLLAVRASYTSARTTGALMFRVLDVHANVVAPMFVMQLIQPMEFLPVFLAMCVPNLLTRRISSCGTVNLSNLLVSVPRSLLIIQQWSGKDALLCVCGFLRVMVVVGLYLYVTFVESGFSNLYGAEGLDLLMNNNASDLFVAWPSPPAGKMPGSVWDVTSGPCQIDDQGCLTAPGWPHVVDHGDNCNINVGMLSVAWWKINVTDFHTTSSDVRLEVNGRNYTGRDGPSWVVPRGNITWHAEVYSSVSVWRLCPVPTGPCLRLPPVKIMWQILKIAGTSAVALYCLSVLGLTIVAVLSLRVGGGSFQPLVPNSAQVQDLAAHIESLCCSKTDQDLRQDIGELQGSVKRVAPLKSCTCCPPGGVYFTVAFVAVDVILDAIMVYNLLMNEDVYFAGIILGTSTFSTVRELRSGSFRSLPSEVIESVRTGKWSTGLLNVLDSERGTEAVISLLVNSYAFPHMAKTPAKFLTSLLSLSTSTLSCASYVHEHFDLEGAMGEDH